MFVFEAKLLKPRCWHRIDRFVRGELDLVQVAPRVRGFRSLAKAADQVSITTNPTAERIAGQVTEAFPWDEAPRHLIQDRDRAFGPAYI
jgi:hypothetical protein